ncbi:MAG: YdcF family protein [Pseudomonadota bacterium]
MADSFSLFKILKITRFIILFWALGYGFYVGSVLTKSVQNPEKKTDAIIVLTGGENRIEEGLKLFANNMTKELFITGVHPSVKKREIVSKWTDGPLPRCCVTLGYEATTTIQNAYETKDWLNKKQEIKTIRLVTSNYHMNRALLEFKHVLKDHKIFAHPTKQENAMPDKLWFWIITFKEYNKTLIRWISFMLHPPENLHGHSTNTHKHEAHS